MAQDLRYSKICMYCHEVYGCVSKSDSKDSKNCDTCTDVQSCVLHGFTISEPKTCKNCIHVATCSKNAICVNFEGWRKCELCEKSKNCKALQHARYNEAKQYGIIAVSHGYCSVKCCDAQYPEELDAILAACKKEKQL